jgi:hypothetical protein
MRQGLELTALLKPLDAIHLATTQNRRVAEFHTTDDRLQKNWTDLEFPVHLPFTSKPKLFPI